MSAPEVQRAQEWLREHETALLEDTRRMVRIASVEDDPAPNAPFGKAVREALDLALELGEGAGMRTKDVDGYAGFAEFGDGERMIASFGHLDVVPVGPGWKHEPFGAEIDGEYLYGRGSLDDKGPTIASFYAARALMETCPDLGVRVRCVFGCNEESGMKCAEHYSKTEEAPSLGIAPDSGWPLYHGEKGIVNLLVEAKISESGFRLLRLEGGQRPNIVIDRCEASVRVSADAKAEVEDALTCAWDRNVAWNWIDSETLSVDAHGKAAHGSFPHGGDSAAIRALRFLRECAPLSAQGFYKDLFEMAHIGGAGLGIAGADEPSKDLTCNLGVVSTEADALRLLFNVRYPVTWSGDMLRRRCEAHLKELEGEFRLADMNDSPPLYFPLEHPLVKAICEAYREETGDDKEPGVMGGGTYARMFPNTVSIGTGWDGDGRAHETDERLKVENLFRMSRIYAHILYRMARL